MAREAFARGYSQITGLSSAKSLGTVPAGATHALVQAEAKDIRWRADGTDPDANVGMLIAAGTTVEIKGQLGRVKIIETSASAKANVTFLG